MEPVRQDAARWLVLCSRRLRAASQMTSGYIAISTTGWPGPSSAPAADAEHPGQGLIPGAGGELLQALALARDPGAGAQGLVDGAGGVTDGAVHVLPRVMVQLGEAVALRAEDLGERADVELAGGGAEWPPRPVRGVRFLSPTWWAVLDLNQ